MQRDKTKIASSTGTGKLYPQFLPNLLKNTMQQFELREGERVVLASIFGGGEEKELKIVLWQAYFPYSSRYIVLLHLILFVNRNM